ncbi:hypothetical protein B0A50_07579 [Salinomyces thailandicus]|uniref:F-box domain-containing protein n=1 Tax=Salinomyces thailandicus TaxID=706561 RepID=A0A4U0TN16_9PEZI|nr:hypothetical protein B0A50_07579 [Salinomyces thailandica]
MSDQSASALLSLPAELRNAIWTYVLVQPLRQPHALCPNVLRTCKQANFEGSPILYGENTFEAHTSLLAALPSCLLLTKPRRITLPPVTHPRVAQMIRRYYMYVRLDTDPRFSQSQTEESFNGAEELEIEVFQSMYGSCDFSVLKLFEGIRGVGKAVVHGSVGDGRYAGWLAEVMMSPSGTDAPAFSERYIGGSKAWDAWQNGHR